MTRLCSRPSILRLRRRPFVRREAASGCDGGPGERSSHVRSQSRGEHSRRSGPMRRMVGAILARDRVAARHSGRSGGPERNDRGRNRDVGRVAPWRKTAWQLRQLASRRRAAARATACIGFAAGPLQIAAERFISSANRYQRQADGPCPSLRSDERPRPPRGRRGRIRRNRVEALESGGGSQDGSVAVAAVRRAPGTRHDRPHGRHRDWPGSRARRAAAIARETRPMTARANPRWVRRRRSRDRARSSRRDIEPVGQPSCRAASSRVCPSRSQSTTGTDISPAVAAIRHRVTRRRSRRSTSAEGSTSGMKSLRQPAVRGPTAGRPAS